MGRYSYFISPTFEDLKPKVLMKISNLARIGYRANEIAVALYYDHNLIRLDLKERCLKPMKLRVKTILKYLYIFGFIKPGLSRVQRLIRLSAKFVSKNVDFGKGMGRNSNREYAAYENRAYSFRRFLAIAEELRFSWVDAALLFMQLNDR